MEKFIAAMMALSGLSLIVIPPILTYILSMPLPTMGMALSMLVGLAICFDAFPGLARKTERGMNARSAQLSV